MIKMIKKTCICYILSLMGILSCSCIEHIYTKSDQKKPNVLLILTDDQGWGDLSINGNKYLQTPNIDCLSIQGVTLDKFYVSPVCAPTRASLLTGRYHLRTGVYRLFPETKRYLSSDTSK